MPPVDAPAAEAAPVVAVVTGRLVAGAATTVIVNGANAADVPLAVTVTVTVAIPRCAALGVHVIRPVAASMVMPAATLALSRLKVCPVTAPAGKTDMDTVAGAATTFG